MSIQTLVLAAILLGPPTPGEPPTPPRPYAETLAEVELLNEKINLGEPVREELLSALSELPAHTPELAASPEERMVRARAQLNLARSYLSADDRNLAIVVMDEVLRSTIGEELPVEEYGPSLSELHDERKAALTEGGTASIEVTCAVPCRVYINERPAEMRTEGLFLGRYRVWVEASDDDEFTLIERINLSEADSATTIEFVPPPPPVVERRPPQPPPTRRKRIMPQPAETTMLVIGLGVTLAGGLVFGLNPEEERINTIIGATLLGVGGTMAVIGGVTLTVDEVRVGKARGRQAMLTWTMRF